MHRRSARAHTCQCTARMHCCVKLANQTLQRMEMTVISHNGMHMMGWEPATPPKQDLSPLQCIWRLG